MNPPMRHPETDTPSDPTLLAAFARERDEAAFRTLVERYAGLVYGVAARRAGTAAADEITQNVFAILAKKASAIDASRGLGAWLHKATQQEAANAARKDQRRHRAMQRYTESLTDDPTPDAELLPVLDDALASLGRDERELIIMRFFEACTFREIGQRLGASEDAGRKRVSRALEKLSSAMRHHGTGRVVPAATLAALLGNALNTTAPASTMSACSASTTSALVASKLAFASSLALVAAVPVALQWRASATSEKRAQAALESEFVRPIDGAEVAAAVAPVIPKGGVDLAALAESLTLIRRGGEPAKLLLDLQAQMFALGETDLPAVGDMLASAPNADYLRPVISSYFARWAEIDPVAAIEETKAERWLTDWVDPGRPRGSPWSHLSDSSVVRFATLAGDARVKVAETWAARDLEAAVAWCREHDSDVLSPFVRQQVFRKWAAEDPVAALAAGKDRLGPAILADWVAADADGACAWALEDAAATGETWLLEWTAGSFAKKEPRAALAFATSIDDAKLRERAIHGTLWSWFARDKREAFGAFLALPEADRHHGLAVGMLDEVGRRPSDGDAEKRVREWLDEQAVEK